MPSIVVPLFFAVLALSSCTDKTDYFPDMNGNAKVSSPLAVASSSKSGGDHRSAPRVRVMPVRGVSLPMAHLLARSVVKNLVELHISAVTDDHAGGNSGEKNDYLLSGKAEASWKDERASFVVIIHWTLVDGGGKPATIFSRGVRASWWQWQNGAPRVIRMVGLSAAKPVADLLAVRKELPAPPELMDTALMVRSVHGAPGDGDHALMRAVVKALRASDVSVTEDPRQASFVLDGVVIVTPDGKNGGKDMGKAVIEWTLKTIKGREVGKSSRRIAIPRGKLNQTWDRIALQSAIGVVADIEKIITGTGLPVHSAPSSGRSSRLPLPERPVLRRVPGRALPPPL